MNYSEALEAHPHLLRDHFTETAPATLGVTLLAIVPAVDVRAWLVQHRHVERDWRILWLTDQLLIDASAPDPERSRWGGIEEGHTGQVRVIPLREVVGLEVSGVHVDRDEVRLAAAYQLNSERVPFPFEGGHHGQRVASEYARFVSELGSRLAR